LGKRKLSTIKASRRLVPRGDRSAKGDRSPAYHLGPPCLEGKKRKKTLGKTHYIVSTGSNKARPYTIRVKEGYCLKQVVGEKEFATSPEKGKVGRGKRERKR